MRILSLCAAAALLVSGTYAQEAGDTKSFEIKREFNEQSFVLGYYVFVAAHNFTAAIETAKIGVQRSQDKSGWLEKLAKVALWSNDTALALKSYKELAGYKQNDEIIGELSRLSMALGDVEGKVIAYEYELKNKKITKEQVADFVSAYESLGNVKQGAEKLINIYKAKKDPALIDSAAFMLERLDDTNNALSMYELERKNHGNSPELAIKTARLLFKKGEFDRAFAAMKEANGLNIPKSAAFYELYGELAWGAQEEKDAKSAYENLSKLATLKDFQVERLVLLTMTEDPKKAAAMAEEAYKKSGSDNMLSQALNVYLAQNENQKALELINFASKKQGSSHAESLPFALAKADLYSRLKLYNAAMSEYEYALTLSQSSDIKNALLATSVDSGNKIAVLHNLRRFEPFLTQNKKYFATLAGAYSALSKHHEALNVYEKLYKTEKTNDALANLAYAYEAIGYDSKALNIKESLWQKAKKGELNATNSADASYIFSKLSSDAKLKTMQKYLSDTKNYTPKYQYLSEIGAFDALKKAVFADAKAKVEAPEWAILPLANEMRDFESIDMLLGSIRILPEYDEMESYTITRREAQKEEAAFAKLENDGYDDESHRRFSENYFEKANNISSGFEYQRQPDIETLHSYLGTKLQAYRDLAISLEFAKNKNILQAQDVLKQSAFEDTRYTVGVDKSYSDEAKSSVRLTKRKSMEELTCVEATYDLSLDRDLSVALLGGYNAEAKESAGLSVGGAKDYALMSVTYRISKREYLKLDNEFDVLKVQNGAKLAEATKTTFSLGYQARTEYPDINTRIYYEFARYRQRALELSDFAQFGSLISPDFTAADLTADALLPSTYSAYGVDIGVGESVSGVNTYSKALRPYAVLSLSNNTRYGKGYSFTSGFVTSLEGKDRLQAYVSYGQGGEGSLLANGVNKSLGFSYLFGF